MLALSATAGCGIESLFVGSGCTRSENSTWNLQEPTDPSTTLAIEDCRADVGACDALCTMELNANVSSEDLDTMTGCTVLFDGSTIHVEVTYDIDSDDAGCDGEPEPGGPLSDASGGAN